MYKKICAALMIILTAIACTSCKNGSGARNDGTPIDVSNQLQILRSDLKLTQEQVMSRIKANHLIENKGYIDTDEVVSIVTLPGDSLIDAYLDGEQLFYSSVAEYASSRKGKKKIEEIKEAQAELVAELKSRF